MLEIIEWCARKLGLRFEGRFGFEVRISGGEFARYQNFSAPPTLTSVSEPILSRSPLRGARRRAHNLNRRDAVEEADV
jgi:hypothetical protein